MSDAMEIRSHAGPYHVHFADAPLALEPNEHLIVDERVAGLYAEELGEALASRSVLRIEATEPNKSLERMPDYVKHLVGKSVRRDHVLVAVGGGIIQDITCFLAATLLRGIAWRFVPTTLLAQADSCIGSKSSINAGDAKNILGTFTPPRRVDIQTRFLKTLDERDVRSGVGEMLKVHAIESPAAFDEIARDYDAIFDDDAVMLRYIRRSLEIKKRIIEIDEFDRGVRNVMNYGHSFGHAIEAATDFAVPHGIAVTIGMDAANFTAARTGRAPESFFARMHPTLRANYRGFESTEIPLDRFFGAIAKDKKNFDAGLSLILPDQEGRLERVRQAGDPAFRAICAEYFESVRAR